MRTNALLAIGFSVALAAPAAAAPRVATDIPAVHSLAARVMAGIGEPELVMPPGTSPHGYAMKPSEAALLQEADVVFWVGPELTPWLGRAVENLSPDATSVELLEAPGVTLLQFREGATFDAHDHDHGHDAGDAHAHEDDHGDEHAHDHGHDHADEHAHEDDHGHDHGDEHAHAHEDDHGHDHGDAHAHEDDHDHGHDHADEHAHAHEDEHAHDHGHDHHHEGVDPHAWLDPVNAQAWLDAMAASLSTADPANASTYVENAAAGKAELDELIGELNADLEPLQGADFVVFHDAYHYFEDRFGMEAAGAISLGDAAAPGPARVAEIRDAIRDMEATCVFREPQFEPGLVATVTEGTDASVGQLDPLGAGLEPGPDLYPTLLRNLRDELVACLGA